MKLDIENPKFLANAKILKTPFDENDGDDKEITELLVNKFFQSFNIKIGFDPNFNNDFDNGICENDIIIEKDFIFALINFEVLTDLNIPSISLNVITKNNWKILN